MKSASSTIATGWATSYGVNKPTGGWTSRALKRGAISCPNGWKNSSAIATTPRWSAGARYNETQKDQDSEFVRFLVNLTRAFDPTRPVLDSSGWTHVDGLCELDRLPQL